MAPDREVDEGINEKKEKGLISAIIWMRAEQEPIDWQGIMR
jgi:hypothetical protein